MNPNFYQFLKDRPAVFTLIGDRIYPEKIPQHLHTEARRMACTVFEKVGGDRQETFCGTDNLVEGSWQFTSYAPLYDDAVAIARAIRRELVDYSGPMGAGQVEAIFLATDQQLPPEPEPGLHLESQTFTVWYRET